MNAVMKDLSDKGLTYRSRCILAWMRLSGKWHTVDEMQNEFSLGNAVYVVTMELFNRGYLDRKEVGRTLQYRVKG